MDDVANNVTFPEISADMVKDLMEIGYVAIGRGSQTAAEDIFNGICAARPESELPIIGLAISKMNFGDFISASKLLSEKAFPLNPNNSLTKCFIGVVYFYCGAKKESLAIMEDILSNSEDESAIKIAQNISSEINNSK